MTEEREFDTTQCISCPVFGKCGGCTHLDVDYREQLARKDARIRALFDVLLSEQAPSNTSAPIFHDIIGMSDPVRYRNKITSPFVYDRRRKGSGGKHRKGGSSSRQILTGMYEAGTHRVIPADDCILENEVGQRVIKAIKTIMRRHGMEPYDEDSGTGFMRHVVVRVGHESGEVLVVLVINAKGFPYAKSFCRELLKAVPEVTSIVANVNESQTNVILGQSEQTLYGPGFILDTLCGLSFRISAHSFYQVNSVQTEVLYEAAIRMADLSQDDTLLDAYCGTGTIGLVAAKRSGCNLIGFDSSKSAIRDARLNAKHNGVKRAEFACCTEDEFFVDFGMRLAQDAEAGELVVMMDPPRSGATEKFLDQIASIRPARIVYVSCNPETQARDVSYLLERGFLIDAIQPVDMFPHTDHIENIVALSR